MKNLLVKLVAGTGLFAGSVVGLLAATGRLNHEGTKDIPLLAKMFEPPAGAEGQAGEVPEEEPSEDTGPPDPGTQDPTAGQEPLPGGHRKPDDIFAPTESGGDGGHGAPAARGDQEPEGEGYRTPDDIFSGEEEKGGGGHGPAKSREHEEEPSGRYDRAHLERLNEHPRAPGESDAETEHRRLMEVLARSQPYVYETGSFFRFGGHESAVSPAQLDQYIKRLTERQKELDERDKSLNLRERELTELEEDLRDRQLELAKARQELEDRQRELDTAIEDFHRTVRLIRPQEEEALEDNARTMASFEPQLAARLFIEQWLEGDDRQTELLKLMHYMEADAANELLARVGMENEAVLKDFFAKRKELALMGEEEKE